MKIALIGADGQLGSDLVKIIDPEELIPLTEDDLDIVNRDLTLKVIKKYSPDVIINTAAYNDVDGCEDNELRAFEVNALGAKNVALACKACGVTMVHFSTDYVFDGEKKEPYIESDLPNPLSTYGLSKRAGEYYVQTILPSNQYLLIRTSGLFGTAGCKGKRRKNFVETMLNLSEDKKEEIRVINDQILSPTYTVDLAKKVKELIFANRSEKCGLYHITNNGQCSWFEFARKIFELAKLKVSLKPITTEEFRARARRPKYSVLKNHRLQEQGHNDLRPWPEALKAYFEERNEEGMIKHEQCIGNKRCL